MDEDQGAGFCRAGGDCLYFTSVLSLCPCPGSRGIRLSCVDRVLEWSPYERTRASFLRRWMLHSSYQILPEIWTSLAWSFQLPTLSSSQRLRSTVSFLKLFILFLDNGRFPCRGKRRCRERARVLDPVSRNGNIFRICSTVSQPGCCRCCRRTRDIPSAQGPPSSRSPTSLASTHLFSLSTMLSFQEYCVSGSRQYVTFGAWCSFRPSGVIRAPVADSIFIAQ